MTHYYIDMVAIQKKIHLQPFLNSLKTNIQFDHWDDELQLKILGFYENS